MRKTIKNKMRIKIYRRGVSRWSARYRNGGRRGIHNSLDEHQRLLDGVDGHLLVQHVLRRLDRVDQVGQRVRLCTENCILLN